MNRLMLALVCMLAANGAFAAKQDLDYERLRASLNTLASDPKLGNLAPAERALAEQSVELLNDSSGGKAEHAHRLYVAERRVDIAYAAAQAVDAERRLAQLDREHDRILIEASRREVENARMDAEKQRIASMVQAEESDRLRVEGEQSAAAADAARAQAAQTTRIADAQAKEAELARKEAQLAELAASDLRGHLQNMRATHGAQGMQMTLDDVAFAPGRAALRPEAKASLGKLVAFVNKDPGKPIRIEGHTDSRGNPNANQILSQKRADSVRDALIAAGVAANRMSSVGLGQDNPVADDSTEEGRAKNRRVDVILEDAPR
ncbi:MAG TPA: OmpA family protein [Rudaea sp.]|jgi:outer membrane protein OmpA-like peptidoglycan-associated protein|nr:OmpA family protein [Rudaea sp.]